MKKVAIICQNEKLWSLAAWQKTLPRLINEKNIEVIGFWSCDEKFVNIPPDKVVQWYRRVFGLYNLILLALFFVLFNVKNLLFRYNQYNFQKLCKKNKIPFFRVSSPNENIIVDWCNENNIDIIVVMVGHIIKKELLNTNIIIINKHASILPTNKGVFPYFWAKLHGEEQGVSLHRVVDKVDSGEIYYQVKYSKKQTKSMISFYYFVYKNYPLYLLNTLSNVCNTPPSIVIDPSLKSSYYSLPTRKDFLIFSKMGGKIITIKDLVLALKL